MVHLKVTYISYLGKKERRLEKRLFFPDLVMMV